MKIKVTFAHGVGACLAWEFKLFDSWEEFAFWLLRETDKTGPITIIAWEYTHA